MLAAHRFEIAPPPPALDVAGGELASGSTTWTALPDLGETTFSDGNPRRDLDYMHARSHSPTTGRFLSVDNHPGRKKRPQSWNRFAYALGNPLKYVDPSGDVAVAFTGLGNDKNSPLRDLVNRIDGQPGVGAARLFRHQDQAAAASFIFRELAMNPNQPVIIAGHSLGANSAAETSRTLGQLGFKVDLLLSLDPPKNHQVSSNVAWAANFFQNNGWIGGGRLTADDPDGTELENYEMKDLEHTELDDVLGSRQILDSFIMEAARRYQLKGRDPKDPFAGTGFCSADNVCH